MGGKNSKPKQQPQPKKQEATAKGKPQQKQQPPPPEGGGKVTSTDEAVMGLKEQRDDLNRAARRSRKLSKALDAEARKYLATDPPQREKALRCVKRRRLYEERLKKIGAMQDNIEEMLNAVETAQFETRVFASLREGSAALQALVKDMGDVEKAMDDVADAVTDAQAVSDLMAQELGVAGSAALDEDALEEELRALTAGESSPAAKAPATKSPLGPDVPSHELPATEKPVTATVEASEADEEPARQPVAA